VAGLRHLGPSDEREAYVFCEQRLDQCTYIAGWLSEGGLHKSTLVSRAWLLAEWEARQISGLIYISTTGIVIPVINTKECYERVTEMARANANTIRVLVGERSTVGQLWARLKKIGMEARIDRDQLGYAVTREEFRPAEPRLDLEVATDAHLDQVVSASAAMAREEAQDDPQARNPDLFRSRIQDRLTRGRDFIYREKNQLLFKTNVAALSTLGGQIEGIYTLPSQRRLGIGRRGTAAVTTWVLERAQRAVLLVNEDNVGARGLYESLGYRPILESRTIFIAP
jgi:ribosomal protein S18 acetylase RimI-like enzyme